MLQYLYNNVTPAVLNFDRRNVPLPPGAVRTVWLLLAGEFKLKSRGSSAVSKSKQGFTKLSIFIERRKIRAKQRFVGGVTIFLFTKKGGYLQFILVPIVLWTQRGPQVGFSGKNATSTADTELDNIQLKRDAR
ncbi:hypothetical protein ABEB36_003662 [Hypothenemus hampei]|uniref:Uncharacterized protein n=1 Tax=Hypothenemus hampei TaxID=57062 RepID=A0ABD1F9Y3_HYPHA